MELVVEEVEKWKEILFLCKWISKFPMCAKNSLSGNFDQNISCLRIEDRDLHKAYFMTA